MPHHGLMNLWDWSTSRWRQIRRGRRQALAFVSIIIVMVIAGSCKAVAGLVGVGTSGVIMAHASATHDTVMTLRDGAKLIIPAGAVTDKATITAHYTSTDPSNQSTEMPIGQQVEFRAQPATAIHGPLLLEWPLPAAANPAAARFGVYAIGTFDTSTKRWLAVETLYDPVRLLLRASIAHFSIWSVVEEVTDDAVNTITCLLPGTLEAAAKRSGLVAAEQFLKCFAKEKLKSTTKAGLGKVLIALLPKSCLSALAVNGLLSLGGPEEIILVATPLTILTTLATEPACAGSSGLPLPTVTAISPNFGPTKGGNEVTITGTPVYLVRRVTFGGVPAMFSFDFNRKASPDSITVTAPAHPAGPVDVRLLSASGASDISYVDRYTYGIPSVQAAQTAGPTGQGNVAVYPVSGGFPGSITAGPDGNLWFTVGGPAGSEIDRITPDGVITEFPPMTTGGLGAVTDLTAGPDGAIWFALPDAIGHLTTAGVLTTFPGLGTTALTLGPDGNMWFNASAGIGRITPDGHVTEFPVGAAVGNDIAAGADGNIWFTTEDDSQIGRITPTGQVTLFPVPTYTGPAGYTGSDLCDNTYPDRLVSGPDGNLWDTMGNQPTILRITTVGSMTWFPLSAGNVCQAVSGPDGDLWFTDTTGVGHITPAGSESSPLPAIQNLEMPSYDVALNYITVGPDGTDLWLAGTNGQNGGVIIRVIP